MLLLRLDKAKLCVLASFFGTVGVFAEAQPPLLSVLEAGREKMRFW